LLLVVAENWLHVKGSAWYAGDGVAFVDVRIVKESLPGRGFCGGQFA
jgi:hypothetical protein